VLALTYGLPIRTQDDPYLALAEEAVRTVSAAAVPGAFLVDFMPFLKYIPEWVPGAGFQTTAKKFFEIQKRFRDEPFNAVLKNIVRSPIPINRVYLPTLILTPQSNGTCRPSFTSVSLETEADKIPEELEVTVADAAGQVYGGTLYSLLYSLVHTMVLNLITQTIAGTDTTLAAVLTFILAMVRHPEVQQKAQAELDRVIHHGERLPGYEDQPDLPYITAVTNEVLRWQPVAPIGTPSTVHLNCRYVPTNVLLDSAQGYPTSRVKTMFSRVIIYPKAQS